MKKSKFLFLTRLSYNVSRAEGLIAAYRSNTTQQIVQITTRIIKSSSVTENHKTLIDIEKAYDRVNK
ncbi:hypothetical protein WA026_015557 [Henosepilachna vigintioctopunctata]|uniref:Reverse transcriptase domain-containing protein n=1 Tax=Henosepilachna vigintioctopunctata TaxID=420089 RepID=A0AAW1V7C1_9CUCU